MLQGNSITYCTAIGAKQIKISPVVLCYMSLTSESFIQGLKAFAPSPSGERLENPSTIEIVVLDQNDNRPNFTQSEFIGYIPEFSVPGRQVHR
ncbi:hypothetical protein GN956_G11059 [Arapaima gigas]